MATSIRETTGRRLHRFSWINEWKELADASGTPLGIELILPDWFFAGVLDAALVLTIDPAYFRLTGGIERWLYRLVRKHGGKQAYGWQFDFRYPEVRQHREALRLRLRSARARRAAVTVSWASSGCPTTAELLTFRPVPQRRTGITPGKACEWCRAIRRAGYRAIRRGTIVLSGVPIGRAAHWVCVL